ncbi:leucine-rich repeat domain-containing protein [Flavobacterium sp. KBS0721]|uniref:leucine-rich repeat domain-containing protein n=1 Tax=Flavobacterium sp. KBS0721 TaxID=1179672 RepID=UPI0009CE8522|nr:leucine-rich repeat domain-containing protein [Flavobacterium sp. KBS0721]
MKTKLLLLFLLSNFFLHAQYTSIPDANFEKKLIAQGIDKGNIDGKVLTSSIANLTVLDLSNRMNDPSSNNILDLTGIQDFKKLTHLNCSYNSISTVDISALKELNILSFYRNNLVALDISNSKNLTFLDVQMNKLKAINVSENINLRTFYCTMNEIESLDISKNISLTDLSCYQNPIVGLDVSKNTALKSLSCGLNSKLKTLNLSANKALTRLDCSASSLVNLDVSGNPNLTEFKCDNNYSLTSLNLKNGNNTKLTVFDITRSDMLRCVQVDDPLYADRYWLRYKEATATFSSNCYGYTTIPDSNFEDRLISLGIDKDGKNGKVLTFSIEKTGMLDLGFKSISDLTGIQDFTNLQVLYCNSNQITNLDLSKNTKLTNLIANSNKLTNLSLAKNTALIELNVDSNLLTDLNVSDNKALLNLSCASNQITQLDLNLNTSLKSLNCSNNKLTNLNLKNNNNTILTTLDLRINPSLSCILVDNKTFSDTNWASKKDATANFNHSTCDVYTLIPDPKFEAKLISLGIDSGDIDGKVLTASISSITNLDVSSSSIINLKGIENFTSLKNLICYENRITNLDLSQNYDLIYLNADKNALTTINLSKNTLLKDLILSNNNLSSVNVSNNFNLVNFNCASNKLLTVDVAKNTKLVSFNFNGNQLKTLDISKNTVLTTLDCGGNQFAFLDFSKNTTLINLNCNRNQLEYLNLKNGKNNILIEPDFKNNPKLICILVDNASYSDTNWVNSKESIASFNEVTCSVLIPDAYFEDKLIRLGIDKDGKNGQISISSVQGVTSLNVASSSISNLTGIEHFKDLEILECAGNNFTALDLSKNIKLKELSFGMNKLTSIDLSKNTALTNLTCYSNLLTNLDTSSNTALKILACDRNKLTSLNVSKNSSLTYLDCSQNQLTTLDVSQNTALGNLDCSTNQLTSLDISKNSSLTWFLCKSNKIETLDVSGNLNLKQLTCSDNRLKSIDVTKNNALTILECSTNNLESVNAKNGNNKSLLRAYFGYNPNLYCILVDNAAYSYANYTIWSKDKEATYSDTFCDNTFTLIPDSNFEDILIKNEIDTDGKNGKVLTKSIASVTTLHILSNSISDLTGIQDFKNLESLNVDNNKLKTIDVSKNLLLTSFSCSENQLTNLDVSKNTLLVELYCSKNQLTSLDISNNTALKAVRCDNNQLKNLDITKNKELGTLYCNSNQLESLNLKNGNNVGLYDTNFTSNPKLTCISVDNSAFSAYYWKTSKDNIATFSTNLCQSDTYALIPDPNFEKKLIDLGIDTDGLNGKITITDASSLTSLDLSNSNIKDLTGIEYFTSLTTLDVSNNQLTTLDVSKNIELETLNASSNQLTTLDLSKNTKLTIVYTLNNPLVSLNLRNGNNSNFILPSNTGKKSASGIYTSFLGLKTLGCIQVDDQNYSNTNWSSIKESTTTYANSCKNLSSPESAFNNVIIHPNPTKGELNIQNVNLGKANVYNTLGQLVKSFTLNPSNTDNTINLSGLPKGIYYIYLINQDAASAKKVIVE